MADGQIVTTLLLRSGSMKRLAAVITAAAMMTSCATTTVLGASDTSDANTDTTVERGTRAPATAAYDTSSSEVVAGSAVWDAEQWFATDPVAIPFFVEATSLTLSDVVLECRDTGIEPNMTVDGDSSAVDITNIDQTISFWGASGPAGAEYTSTDDLVGLGVEETFGEWGPAGDPGDRPADNDAICSSAMWPITVSLDNGVGERTDVVVLATIEDRR